MSKAPSIQFYPGDRLREIMPVMGDSEAVGAWCKAWMYLWGAGPSPVNVVAQVAGKGWDKVGFLFRENEGLVSLDWMEEKRSETTAFRERQAANGRKGGRPKSNADKGKNPGLSSGITQTKAKKSPRVEGGGEEEGESKSTKEREAKVITLPFTSEAFALAFAAFDDMRRKKGKPMTERARSMIITDLMKMGEAGAIESLNKSTRSGWTDVYPPKVQQETTALPIGARDISTSWDITAKAQ